MSMRRATIDDLDTIADLAQDQRIRLEGWDPGFFASSPRARTVDPLFLRAAVDRSAGVSEVVTRRDGTVGGFAFAHPIGAPAEPGAWLIDRIELASPTTWSSVGVALLAHVAGRAKRHGATRLVLGCSPADTMRRQALRRAGLERSCWFRHARLDRVRPATIELPDDNGLPLPRLHGWSGLASRMTAFRIDGGQAMVSPPVRTPPWGRPSDGTTGLADPIVATDHPSLWRLIDALESHARERGDGSMSVAVTAGEGPLDGALDARGYTQAVEWWTWELERRSWPAASPRPHAQAVPPRPSEPRPSEPQGRPQLQPLVEPHSTHT